MSAGAPIPRGVVVTADDFGMATPVNEAVEDAHVNGVLSAASLMVAGAAAEDAVARARRLPGLRVGLHLVLTDGRAALDPTAVPGLTDRDGRFKGSMVEAAVRMFFRPSVRLQLAAEIEAQFEAFRATGLALDHVNAHKHFHLHPTIAALILRIGPRFGMRALRVPREPAWVGGSAPARAVSGPWIGLLARRARQAGLIVPDAVFGLAWSGHWTGERLARVLGRLPPGLTEVYLHPATADEFPGHAPGYGYREEYAALVDPTVVAALAGARVAHGGYSDFAGRQAAIGSRQSG